jgi:hypothetical protein
VDDGLFESERKNVDETLLACHLYFGFVCFWHEMEEENHQNEIEKRNNLFPTTIFP